MVNDQLQLLFVGFRKGDEQARDALFFMLYPILKGFIRKRFSRYIRASSTIQTTLILNDLLMILDKKRDLKIKDLGSITAFATKVLREYFVDYYRKKQAEKRGGGLALLSLDKAEYVTTTNDAEFLVAYDNAIRRLEEKNIKARCIMDLKIIGGFSNLQVAEFLGTTEYVVKREFNFYKLWLSKNLFNHQVTINQSLVDQEL